MDNTYYNYLIYIGFYGNLDYVTQSELVPLSYEEFKKIEDCDRIIDFIKKKVYNIGE